MEAGTIGFMGGILGLAFSYGISFAINSFAAAGNSISLGGIVGVGAVSYTHLFDEETFLADLESLRKVAGVDNVKMVELVHRLVPTYTGHAERSDALAAE